MCIKPRKYQFLISEKKKMNESWNNILLLSVAINVERQGNSQDIKCKKFLTN